MSITQEKAESILDQVEESASEIVVAKNDN